jgi:hypothetical protein
MFPTGPVHAPAAADVAQHIIGQRYFMSDDWHWPLLKTTLLDTPTGVNIAFTDSIPLVALLGKVLHPLLPPGFNFVYLWLGLSLALQPVGAVFALHGTGERRLLPSLAAAVIAASMPTLYWRYPHAALSAHFVLLVGLGIYLRAVRGHSRVLAIGSACMPLTLLIHPYLMVMYVGILAAAPLTLLLRRNRAWRREALCVLLGLVSTVAFALLLGYLGNGSPGGFGEYSMNMLAPIYPDHSALFDQLHLPMPSDQAEGYQYLGAGLIAAILFAITLQWRTVLQVTSSHLGLVLFCASCTLFALSTKVYLGDHLILALRNPRIFEQFRASGRFFWPVAYVLLIGAVALLARVQQRWLMATLLLGCIGLQVTDARALEHRMYFELHATRQWPFDETALRALMASSSHLTILPKMGCGAHHEWPPFLEIILLASDYHLPINTMYLARGNERTSCESIRSASEPIGQGELRIFLPEASWASIQAVPDRSRFCGMLGHLVVCSREVEREAQLQPVERPTPTSIDIGVEYLTSKDQPGARFLGGGWSPPEGSGTWSEGGSADLAFRLEEASDQDLRLTLTGVAYVLHFGRQTIAITANGKPLGRWEFRSDRANLTQNGSWSVDLPADLAQKRDVFLELQIGEPTSPEENRSSGDTRKLGFFLRSIRLSPR